MRRYLTGDDRPPCNVQSHAIEWAKRRFSSHLITSTRYIRPTDVGSYLRDRLSGNIIYPSISWAILNLIFVTILNVTFITCMFMTRIWHYFIASIPIRLSCLKYLDCSVFRLDRHCRVRYRELLSSSRIRITTRAESRDMNAWLARARHAEIVSCDLLRKSEQDLRNPNGSTSRVAESLD